MKYDAKTGTVRGHLFEHIVDPCEVCGDTDEDHLSFHAGQACLIMFKKATIVICETCWKHKYKEVFNEEWE